MDEQEFIENLLDEDVREAYLERVTQQIDKLFYMWAEVDDVDLIRQIVREIVEHDMYWEVLRTGYHEPMQFKLSVHSDLREL